MVATRTLPPVVGTIEAAPVFRIISDLHFGDRAKSVHELARLAPLVADASELVLNGDTLEIRPGPDLDRAIELREILYVFVQSYPVNVRLITDNHDPDISTAHLYVLADCSVLITHGDIAFDDIVPWSQDAPLAHARCQPRLPSGCPSHRCGRHPPAPSIGEPALALFAGYCSGYHLAGQTHSSHPPRMGRAAFPHGRRPVSLWSVTPTARVIGVNPTDC
jgi:hypothetical protein